MGMAKVSDDAAHEFSDYENLAKKKPWAGFTLVVGIGSAGGNSSFGRFYRQITFI